MARIAARLVSQTASDSLRSHPALTVVPPGMHTATLSQDLYQLLTATVSLSMTIRYQIFELASFHCIHSPPFFSTKLRYKCPKAPAVRQSVISDNLIMLSAHLSLYP